MTVTASAAISATEMASQTPSIFRKTGRINTLAHWKISVRRKDMTAEARPLLRAVKKDEPKMLIPHRR